MEFYIGQSFDTYDGWVTIDELNYDDQDKALITVINGFGISSRVVSYEALKELTRPPRCECGSAKLNHPGHSEWCPMFKGSSK